MGRLQGQGSIKRRGRPLIGGPADGATSARGDIFIYADSAPTIRTKAFPGAELYRREGGAFRYVERELARCSGCGAYVTRGVVEACPLCGTAS